DLDCLVAELTGCRWATLLPMRRPFPLAEKVIGASLGAPMACRRCRRTTPGSSVTVASSARRAVATATSGASSAEPYRSGPPAGRTPQKRTGQARRGGRPAVRLARHRGSTASPSSTLLLRRQAIRRAGWIRVVVGEVGFGLVGT